MGYNNDPYNYIPCIHSRDPADCGVCKKYGSQSFRIKTPEEKFRDFCEQNDAYFKSDYEEYGFESRPCENYSLNDDYLFFNINPPINKPQLKKAYRRLCLIHHPDKPTGSHEGFLKLSTSYERLCSLI